MRNWDEMHECEDSRDADRLRKRQSTNKKMQKYSKDVISHLPPEFWDDPSSVKAAEALPCDQLDPQTAFTLASFVGVNWLGNSATLTSPPRAVVDGSSPTSDIQDPFAPLRDYKKRWAKQIDLAARERAHTRRAFLDPSKQTISSIEPESRIVSTNQMLAANVDKKILEAGLLVPTTGNLVSTRAWDEILEGIEKEYGLNERQIWCFRIRANRFRTIMAKKDQSCVRVETAEDSCPLRFLMTGPGGTGKTHTTTAFQRLMSMFNMGHLIRFLAPTGDTAVNLPNGQTIHKACGISVFDDSDKSGWHALRLTVSLEKLGQLGKTWNFYSWMKYRLLAPNCYVILI